MYYIISIDTEEDNWDNFQDQPTLNNIKRIIQLQRLFDNYKVKPTYLITYPVATDGNSVNILKSILDSRKCEIGTHLHPWNTPPIENGRTSVKTMLNQIESELQLKKLNNLHQKIQNSFNIEPVSFRAGRYGLNVTMITNLIKLNYSVESSITPFIDWRMYAGPDYSNFNLLQPYLMSDKSLDKEDKEGKIIEVPLSVGYLQSHFERSNYLFNKFKYPPYRYLRIIGLLSKFNLLNKIRLTPEGYSAQEMKGLIRAMSENGIKIFNLSFHSNTLLPGCTPFVRSHGEFTKFMKNLDEIIQYFTEQNFESITLSQVPDKISEVD